MKYLSTFLLVLSFLFLSFDKNDFTIDETIKAEIHKVENGLTPAIRLIDESVKQFNLLERMAHYQVPGVSIAIIKDGKIHWTKTYGFANAHKENKLDENTLFQSASISKAVSALAVLKLVDEGKLELDREANDYLKDWQIEDNEFTVKEKVSIRRLLTHTAGLNVHGFDGYPQNEKLVSTLDVLNGHGNSRKVRVIAVPGSDWKYSGGGYIVLQKIVEDLTGMPFGEYMNKEILPPLGMDNSIYQQPLNTDEYINVSAGHTREGEILEGLWNNYSEMCPAGLWTTPTDLAKYCLSIQQIIAGDKNDFLSKETIDLMLTKHLNDWGLGPWVPGENENLRFSHSGSNHGYKTDFFAFAYRGDGVAFMCNGDNGGNLGNEFMRSVSDCYNWNTHAQQIIEPLSLTEEELQNYVGQYSWVDRSSYRVEVLIKDGALVFIAPGDNGQTVLNLTPLTDLNFLDIVKNRSINFSLNEESAVKNLTWRGYLFEKMD